MIHLKVMGPTELVQSDGRSVQSVLSQPKRLALLSYLALEGTKGPCRRDTLLALFWVERDDAQARNSLRQAIHFLRRSLGRDLLETTGDDTLRLDGAVVRCDVEDFREAVEAGDVDRALSMYEGPLLDGFFVDDAAEFMRWLEIQRQTLHEQVFDLTCSRLQELEEAGDLDGALTLVRAAVRMRPLHEPSARRLMGLLAAAGDRPGAVATFKALQHGLNEELGVLPEEETVVLADAILTDGTPRSSESAGTRAPAAASESPGGRRPWRIPGLPTGAFGRAAVVSVLVLMAFWLLPLATEAPLPGFYESPFAEWERPVLGATQYALSPDGEVLVYQLPGADGRMSLWARRWTSATATRIPGTEGARGPAFSPDGERLAYTQDFTLKVRDLRGGPVATAGAGTLTAWSAAGRLYGVNGQLDQAFALSPAGGRPERVTQRVSGEVVRYVHDDLPNGWRLLSVEFVDHRPGEIWGLDKGSRETKLLTRGRSPTFTDTGHLVYISSDGWLTIARLDLRHMEIDRESRRTVDSNVVRYSVARDASRLFYTTDIRAAETLTDEVMWVDRSGAIEPIDFPFRRPNVFTFGWSLSPDGRRLAVSNRSTTVSDIWIKDLPSGPTARLTTDPSADVNPWWSPGGDEVGYMSWDGRGPFSAFARRADGSGVRRLLYADSVSYSAGVWSPDGRWLLLGSGARGVRADIVALQVGVDSVPTPLIATEAAERSPALSPDGAWLAFSSDRTGRPEIYVRPFPNVGDSEVLVSTNGGIVPVWARSGQELFFIDRARTLTAARVATRGAFAVAAVDTLFTLPDDFYLNTGGLSKSFDVSSDDRRFVFGRPRPRLNERSEVRMFVVTDFAGVLRRR